MYLDTKQTDEYAPLYQRNEMPLETSHFVQLRCALVVDDDFSMREIVASALEKIGLKVRTAENGRKAYDLFLKGKWDLVVTDFMMPIMDGVTLLKKIKQHAPSTPTILISGAALDALPGRNSGLVDSILSKPFKIRDLHREVMRVIQ